MADSVNAIAGMANASDEDLAAMVANWQALQEEQAQVADSITELKTNFTAEMDLLQQELEADIEAMNLSGDALEAGQATIEAYISAVDGMLPAVAAAYEKVGQAAVAAMASSGYSGLPSKPGGATPSAYASGTTNAKAGWAWVGEEGPELMYMNGGETVIPADVSAEIAGATPMGSSAGGSNSIQVTFQIGGDITNEGVDRLSAFGDEFVERVKQVLADLGAENTRRAYA